MEVFVDRVWSSAKEKNSQQLQNNDSAIIKKNIKGKATKSRWLEMLNIIETFPWNCVLWSEAQQQLITTNSQAGSGIGLVQRRLEQKEPLL